MSRRAGIKISDKRDGQIYRLYKHCDGELENTGKVLSEKIQEYIGRNNLFNLYDLYECIYNDIDYKVADQDCWDEEFRYYIDIISDTEIKYTITSIDFNATTDMKNAVYTVDVSKVFNIKQDKPHYHIKVTQEELDFLKTYIERVMNDDDIISEKKILAKSLYSKL